MKRFDNNLIEKVRNKAKLTEIITDYTKLDRKKKGHWAICPFHDEKSASLHIEPSRGVYYCHGCHAKGDVYTLVMNLNGLAFGDAVRHVAERFGIELDEAVDDDRIQAQYRMRRALDITCEHYTKELGQNMTAMAYLKSRGIQQASIDGWSLGFARRGDTALEEKLRGYGLVMAAVDAGILNEGRHGLYQVFGGRLIFPVKNKIGKVVTFAGRDITGNLKAKYINGKETGLYQKSQILYGLQSALKPIRTEDQIVICEGYLDVIHMHQAGYKETVATCGTALTKEMVKSFSRLTKKCICFFDGDDAGIRAAMKALPVLTHYNVDAYLASLPSGKDPADVCQEDEIVAVDAVMDAKPLLDSWLNNISRRYPNTPNGRQEAAIVIKPVVNSYNGVAKDEVIRKAAHCLRVSKAALGSLVSEAPTIESIRKTGRSPDPLAMSLVRLCIVKQDLLKEIKKKIKLKWIEGEEEQAVVSLLLSGAPIHEAARKAAPFLQGPLLKIAVSDDTACSINQTISRLELRAIEKSLPDLTGRERLDAQRKRLKLQWNTNH